MLRPDSHPPTHAEAWREIKGFSFSHDPKLSSVTILLSATEQLAPGRELTRLNRFLAVVSRHWSPETQNSSECTFEL
jgi:hypothetical protein